LSLGGECVDYKPLNGTIYRMSTEVIGIGDSLAPVTQQKWCAVESQYGTIHNCFDTESECNEWNTTATFNGQRSCTYMTITTGVTDYETDVNNISSNYFLRHQVVNDIVTESYIGFRITPAMVSANSNLTAGTYYLRGGTGGSSYNSNLATLQTAFGTNGCSSGPAISYCSATGLSIIFNSTDWVQAGPGSITENCQIHDDAVGRSECIIGS
ncbi:MAG: hypothetical protein IKI04_02720, partial [Bacilli bacterium]|nr:hypothetical protein [Bacilli bacterium]